MPSVWKRLYWRICVRMSVVCKWFKLQYVKLRCSTGWIKMGDIVACDGFSVKINDAGNFYILYKDIFYRKIYDFTSKSDKPLIIDCGSNIGMSVLYYKYKYPESKVIAFEPDPVIYDFLEYNMSVNKLCDVTAYKSAVSVDSSERKLCSDGLYGTCLEAYEPKDINGKWAKYKVHCSRLKDFLSVPVDFVKINIEGAEWDVLRDAADNLANVNQMVIEYHHLPGLPRTLHNILELLDSHGFEYLINDFDNETNRHVAPPFILYPETRYYLLIYAKKIN